MTGGVLVMPAMGLSCWSVSVLCAGPVTANRGLAAFGTAGTELTGRRTGVAAALGKLTAPMTHGGPERPIGALLRPEGLNLAAVCTGVKLKLGKGAASDLVLPPLILAGCLGNPCKAGPTALIVFD